uniref:Uncharacterized protein n=1 Tax=Arundo donax TaxID=35708 RepID=A0A0A9AHV3_ARUDO
MLRLQIMLPCCFLFAYVYIFLIKFDVKIQ